MYKFILGALIVSFFASCSSPSECHCNELYQDDDSLYYFAEYDNPETNKLAATALGAKTKVASLKRKKALLQQEEKNLLLGNNGTDEDSGNYADSINIAEQKLLEAKDRSDLTSTFTLLNRLSIFYTNQSDFNKAIRCSHEALKVAEKTGDKKKMATVYYNLSVIYSYNDNYTRSLESALNALNIREHTGDKNGLFYSLMQIASLYDQKGEDKAATAYAEKAEKVFKELDGNDPSKTFSLGMFRASLSARKGGNALPVLENLHAAIYDKLDESRQIALLSQLEYAYRNKHNTKKQMEVLEKLSALEPNNYRHKMRLKAAKGEMPAIEAEREIMLQDSVKAREFTKRMMASEGRQSELEVKQKELEIQILKTELEARSATMKLQRKLIRIGKEETPYSGTCKSANREGTFDKGRASWKAIK